MRATAPGSTRPTAVRPGRPSASSPTVRPCCSATPDQLRFVPDTLQCRLAPAHLSGLGPDQRRAMAPRSTPPTNGGATAFSTDVDTASITVTDVNDAPVLDDSGSPTLHRHHRGRDRQRGRLGLVDRRARSATWTTGRWKASPSPACRNGNGAWQYSIDGGSTWTAVGIRLRQFGPVAPRETTLRFVPDTLNADSASVSYRAWDQTSGSVRDQGRRHRPTVARRPSART